MSKESGQRDTEDILASIDALIPKQEASPFEFEKVKNFTDWIFLYRHKVDKELGLEEAGENITALKDTSILLVRKGKDGQQFPGSRPLREELKTIMAVRQKDKAATQYRGFRNKVLSHMLSADIDTIPEALQETALDIRNTYTALYNKLKPEYSNPKYKSI
jgi:hypothetical protein